MHDRNGRIFGAVAVVRDITEHKRLVHDLQAALSDIKRLSGMLPICSSCKRIRDEKGSWVELESYICRHSDADFTHSL